MASTRTATTRKAAATTSGGIAGTADSTRAEPTPVRLPAPVRVPAPVPTPSEVRTMIWGLESLGWTPREAGNVVAVAHGLRPARDGWTSREIAHLRFLRSLVRAGGIAA